MSDTPDDLVNRLQAVFGKRSYRELGGLTNTHHETVRRYAMGKAVPSVKFLTCLSHELGINAHWLLTGQGPMRITDIRGDALQEANISELLAAMGAAIDALIGRVERLEVFVQTVESRVSARVLASANGKASPRADEVADAILQRRTAPTQQDAGATTNPSSIPSLDPKPSEGEAPDPPTKPGRARPNKRRDDPPGDT